eukprot:CAMPEP_0171214840 /NCGR_PEP_ID=MMETSP0790-20130122/31364_1 /TAXON_ID=2925 /ORGANISM="Alexandrium catenella, Strain OF101" /LENGTH=116 /DNA_ID=CAMNT_0011680585 /DNA_START=293 /DNA_END=645 /DNA_ORIENTATION=-
MAVQQLPHKLDLQRGLGLQMVQGLRWYVGVVRDSFLFLRQREVRQEQAQQLGGMRVFFLSRTVCAGTFVGTARLSAQGGRFSRVLRGPGELPRPHEGHEGCAPSSLQQLPMSVGVA